MSIIKFLKLANLYPYKRAIITGAGSGLGWELTNYLLQDGWKVLALDLSTSKLDSIASKNLVIHTVDVTNRKALTETITQFCNQNNGVDLLFNNAGVGEGSMFVDYTLDNWDWIIDINLKSVIAGTHEVLPYMLKQNSGTIIWPAWRVSLICLE